jgi:hypothetical protein
MRVHPYVLVDAGQSSRLALTLAAQDSPALGPVLGEGDIALAYKQSLGLKAQAERREAPPRRSQGEQQYRHVCSGIGRSVHAAYSRSNSTTSLMPSDNIATSQTKPKTPSTRAQGQPETTTSHPSLACIKHQTQEGLNSRHPRTCAERTKANGPYSR